MNDGRTSGGPLLERGEALAAVEDARAAAAAGHGRLLVVEGHAGLGKTRVLSAAAAQAERSGMTVLRATADPMERDFPHGVTLQLFERRMAAADPDERADVLGGAAQPAGHLLDRHGTPGGFPVLHGLYWLTSNLAERRPLVLVVDDLQDADEPSLRFLAYLAPRLDDIRVLVIAAQRPGGATDDLRRDLVGRGRRIVLPGLSGEGVAQLVRGRLPDAVDTFCAAMARITGGNPFLLAEVLREVALRGLRPDEEGAAALADLTPDSVLATTAARIGRLPAGCLRLARAVAVLGSSAHLRHARALAELDADAATEALDALVDVAILEPGRPVAFVHPLLRSAVRAAIPPAERSRQHARAARLLDEDGAPVDLVAGQLLHAPHQADPWVVDRLRAAAADAAAHLATDSVRDYLRRALEEPPTSDVLPSVLIDLGAAEAVLGDPRAAETLVRALDLVDDARTRAEVLLRLATTVMRSSGPTAAAPLFDRGLRELDETADDPLVHSLLTGYVGTSLLDRSRAQEVDERFAALRTAPPLSFRGWRPGLLATAALLRVTRGAPYDDVLTLARRALGDGDLLASQGPESPTFWAAAHTLAWCDAYDEVIDAVRAVTADPRYRPTSPSAALVAYTRSWPLLWSGRVDQAVGDLEVAVRTWQASGGMYLPVAAGFLAWGLLETGDVEGAAAALRLDEPGERWGGTALLAFYEVAHGRLLVAQGRSEEAVAAFTRAGEHCEPARVRNPAIVPWRSGAAVAVAHLDPDRARILAAEEVGLARAFGAPRALGVALRAAGVVAEGERQLELLAEAVAVLAPSPARLEHARALADLGAALRRRGRRREARDRLRQAAILLEDGGATVLARRVAAELSAAGGRRPPRRGSGAASLTASERRVAELAAGGATNRQIAQGLFVSVKAVEWHLGNGYRKLGLTSRAGLAAALEASGERPDDPEPDAGVRP